MKDPNKQQEQEFESYLDSVEVRNFFERARRELFPKINDSAVFLSLYSGDIDPSFCMQLGAAILLRKPILVVAVKGAEVPPKLVAIADKVLHIEMDAPDAHEKLRAAVAELIGDKPR